MKLNYCYCSLMIFLHIKFTELLHLNQIKEKWEQLCFRYCNFYSTQLSLEY